MEIVSKSCSTPRLGTRAKESSVTASIWVVQTRLRSESKLCMNGRKPVQYRPITRPSRVICVRVMPLGPEKQRAMPGHDEAKRNFGGGRKGY